MGIISVQFELSGYEGSYVIVKGVYFMDGLFKMTRDNYWGLSS